MRADDADERTNAGPAPDKELAQGIAFDGRSRDKRKGRHLLLMIADAASYSAPTYRALALHCSQLRRYDHALSCLGRFSSDRCALLTLYLDLGR